MYLLPVNPVASEAASVSRAVSPGRAVGPGSLRRALKILFWGLLVSILAAGLLVWWAVLRPLPQTSGTWHLAGLRAPVEVERDAAGVPHLRAQSAEDLYLAQGFVTAQDRLWHLELLRRVARGEVAEIVGPAALPLDVDSRKLGLRAAAEAAAGSLPEVERRLLESYGRGVNEFVRSHQDRLPVEFRLLRMSPRPWTAADSVAIGLHMFRVLSTTWRDETMKEALLEKAGPERTAELLPTRTDRDHPPEEQVQSPTSKVQSHEPPSSAGAGANAAALGFSTLDLGLWTLDSGFSNNWVVSGAHTVSGKAMLANDPHLGYSIPCTWYTVHLQAPGLNVAGVSLPGLPGVILGHNERIAWGATNLGADVQDLYVEAFDRGHPPRYLVDGQWKEVQVREEIIRVRGQSERRLAIEVTRHGPVIARRGGRRYALRWVALEPGLWSFPFLQIDAARNWAEFTAALRRYPGPTQNFVYADAEGNIGYYGAGLIPVRAKGDGSLPLPGDSSSNDWTGYIPFEQLPHVYNPPSGILATANARVVPNDYPYPVATRWETPDRTERIYALLAQPALGAGRLPASAPALVPGSAPRFTAEDFRRFQVDVYAGHHHKIARALREAVAKTGAQDARLKRAAEVLGAWDGWAQKDSTATGIAEFARQELLEQLLRPVLGESVGLYSWRMSAVFLERVLEERPSRWLPRQVPGYDQLLVRCLAAALDRLEKRFQTPDPQKWRWGQVMETSFVHPIGGRLPVLKRFLNVGPFEQPGTSYSVKQTTPALGPSMRFVVDFGDIEHATLTLTTGESGQPGSPHYRDQFAKWIAGEGVPLSFTFGAPGRERLVLTP